MLNSSPFGPNPMLSLELPNLFFIYLETTEENIKNFLKPHLIPQTPWRIRVATSAAAFLSFKEKLRLVVPQNKMLCPAMKQ